MPPDALDIAHRRPALTIATIGAGARSHEQFLAALSRLLAQQAEANLIAFEAMLAAGREREGAQLWRSLPHIAYDSGGRHYLHYALADDAQCLRHLITWSHQLDGLILLLNAQNGALAQAARSLALLRQLQAPPQLMLFLDQPEAAPPADWLTLVEDEARAQISQWGYDGASIPLIQGSIDAALRSPAPDPHAPEEAPFLHLLRLPAHL
jgi:elongation factor Tu